MRQEGVFRKGEPCFQYNTRTGKQRTFNGSCTVHHEQFDMDMSDCTWLQVRHYKHIQRPPPPYVKGVQFTRQAKQSQGDGMLFSKGAQILTDVDDTIKCSGGQQPAGNDETCKDTEPGAFYPGVVAFYKALALGHRDPESKIPPSQFPIPLSARPQKLSAIMGTKQCRKLDLHFRELMCGCTEAECDENVEGDKCGCFGLNTADAQYGHLLDYLTDRPKELIYLDLADMEKKRGKPVFESGGYAKMAQSKFRGFINLVKQGRGHETQVPMVFVGDNGQGDFSAAQMMLRFRDMQGKSRMHAAFIHYVRKDLGPGEFEAAQKAWAEQRIYLFRDYLEAGRIALNKALTSQKNFDVFKAAYLKDKENEHKVRYLDNEYEIMSESDDLEVKRMKAEYKRFIHRVRSEDWDDCSADPSRTSRLRSNARFIAGLMINDGFPL
eukprot:TRINITY_DN14025_c0_g6_i1.p1 TRINITY_DN14025_c0_g6~~TRINITY_DN14025_c0_g6_i1.p1  ORF type:complete len:437 (+),score=34.31 TRINITY_DN14025_c0_g6_i1:367-1677(+)